MSPGQGMAIPCRGELEGGRSSSRVRSTTKIDCDVIYLTVIKYVLFYSESVWDTIICEAEKAQKNPRSGLLGLNLNEADFI